MKVAWAADDDSMSYYTGGTGAEWVASLGHTVTTMTPQVAESSDLSVYDLVILANHDLTAAARLSIRSQGVPLVLTATVDLAPHVDLRIVSASESIYDGQDFWVIGDHAINQAAGFADGHGINGSIRRHEYLADTAEWVGVVYGSISLTTMLPTGIAVEAGTLDLAGAAFPARVGWAGWWWPGEDMTGSYADGRTWAEAVINWAGAGAAAGGAARSRLPHLRAHRQRLRG